MKDINQLIHLTSSFENLELILKNGIHSSYALENFNGSNILIPMISFSNLLFRDIGQTEVIDYGSYGLGIEREIGIEFNLNPVVYVYEDSIIEKGIKNNFEFSILPQTLSIMKNFYEDCKCITNHINFNPLPVEVKNLINSISADTNNVLIEAIKTLFEKVFINSYQQILLAKPYKVYKKNNTQFFAYNEREWRKSFFDLDFIREIKPNGELNDHFIEIKKLKKPHLTDEKYTLKIPIEKIRYIIVKEVEEKNKISELLVKINGLIPKNLIIETLEELKNKEK